MKTMIDLAIEVVSSDKDRWFTFEEIFEHVENNLRESWTNNFVNEKNDYEQIKTKKLGELYRFLTVTGSFSRNSDGLWKINVHKFN
ncbi:DNA-directed RNA polymerase subunit delta [Mycoplasmopsis alligatoris]|uniref:HTH HARE-type domain-containing protein n=1 Tax=Mycoplasmopsis alligatoris A21JP2 TaxID=747682 RepID=D4XVA9_9BACT|nr:hypothetical protein [Mycoplasmopsis alligatoris]EFF41624.1 conserved hypothetical protein [Mycoplasmopsis alligatoris A21JP2]